MKKVYDTQKGCKNCPRLSVVDTGRVNQVKKITEQRKKIQKAPEGHKKCFRRSVVEEERVEQ